LKLFPYKSYSANTPSYPSGHTIEAIVVLNVIGNKYPTEYQFCKELIEDIAYSRVYLGLHFPSDNDGAREIAKEILKHTEFTKKYGI
jgi:membrane-associated phospholipid phosphatase